MIAPQAELEEIIAAMVTADRSLIEALDARTQAFERYRQLRESAPDAYLLLPSMQEILANASEQAKQYPKKSLERILREVHGATHALIAPKRVAMLTNDHDFASIAATHQFSVNIEVDYRSDIHALVEAVERQLVDHAVVPFETYQGSTPYDLLDHLLSSSVQICAAVRMAHRYDLVAQNASPKQITSVYASSDAFNACEKNLEQWKSDVQRIVVSGSEAAAAHARQDANAAAILAKDARETEQLETLHSHLEDVLGLETRFVILGRRAARRTGKDRTILALATHDAPGALHRALQPFADRGVNLTRIDSRRSTTHRFERLFALELDGHVTDRSVLTTIEEVRSAARDLKVLGSFPRDTP